MNKETSRYWLSDFFDNKVLNTHEYEFYQREIKSKGSVRIQQMQETVKIYTAELALILSSDELSIKDLDSKDEAIISGLDYIDTYIEGFNEGEKYFEKEFSISPQILYGEKAEQYISDLHFNYYHSKIDGNDGWQFIKTSYPIILTFDIVNKYGYYSGIVNRVDELLKKYPIIFQNFANCNHNNDDELWFENQKSINNDSFFYFGKYFKIHSHLMMIKKHYLYTYKSPTSDYFIAIRDEETKVKNVAEKFISEIRNTTLGIESGKLKLYLEQIQSELNSIYSILESDNRFSDYISVLFDISIPSIQNLIRDIARKNSIVITGDSIMQEETTELEETKSLSIKNNFDNTDINEVYNYFNQELVMKNYLSAEDLVSFLQFSFDKNEIPQKLFRFSNAPTKQKIINIFYEYYKSIAGKPHGKQRQYAALLGDYFNGYKTENVSSNFNK